MAWSDGYVGLPFRDHGRDRSGCDCWGLVRLVYSEELDIELPSYHGDYVDASEHAEIDHLLTAGAAAGPWREVTDTPPARAFDVLVFRVGSFRSHVALAVDRHLMLHLEGGRSASVVPQTDSRWSTRLVGRFRYEAPA